MYLRGKKDGSGDDREEEPPVPMPNTEVKLFIVDGTWRETARESRTLPEQRERLLKYQQSFFLHARHENRSLNY